MLHKFAYKMYTFRLQLSQCLGRNYIQTCTAAISLFLKDHYPQIQNSLLLLLYNYTHIHCIIITFLTTKVYVEKEYIVI